MSKFKLTISSDNYYMDSNSFAGKGDSDIAILSAGSLSVVGVDSITGSTGTDSIRLLGLTAAQALSIFGVSTALSAVTTLTYDTNNTLAATVDSLLGTVVAEAITLKNTGTVKSVNLKYASGSTTVADTLTIATPASPATLVSDTITLSGASKINLTSDSTTGATDNIIGSSGADNITLSDGDAESAPATAFWNYKSGGGMDTITGDGGADKITLTAASSIKYATGGNTSDSIVGSSGNDSVSLVAATTLNYATGGGTDTVIGSTGVDTLTLTTAAVILKYSSNGITNQDKLTGGAGADLITLTVGSNVSIAGGGGNDVIVGSSSADTIVVTSASTTIQGGGGADALTGATTTGADVFNYISKSDSGATSTTRDTITNFNAGDSAAAPPVTSVDTLKFTGLQVGTFALLSGDRATDTTTTAVAEWGGDGNSQARFYDSGTSIGLLEIDVDGNAIADMSIMLTGVRLANLTGADFSWT